jgi:cytochrome P450
MLGNLIEYGAFTNYATSRFDWGGGIILLPYGPQWKKQRRIMHEILKPSAASNSYALFEKETHGLLRRLLTGPESFEKELRRRVTNNTAFLCT